MRPSPASAIGAAFLLLALLLAMAPGPAHAATCATASYYGTESGRTTANGEHFDGRHLTAAHRSLPFGTRIRVTYRGRSIVVRINDRGPAKWTHRDLDLSKAAAEALGMIRAGTGRVCWEVV